MKKCGRIGLSVVATACCATIAGQSVFAANPYGITYSGGEPLGASNVNIDPNLKNFSNLVTAGNYNNIYDPKDVKMLGDKWEEGYLKMAGRCDQFSYIKISNTSEYDVNNNLGWVMYGDAYEVRNSIQNIVIDGVTQFDNGKLTTVGVRKRDGFLMVGFGSSGDSSIYKDNKCQEEVAGLEEFNSESPMSEDKWIFVETKTRLFKKGTNESLTSGEIYYVISDIDAAQSYKILNPGLQLNANNMYAIDAKDLQHNVTEYTDLKNMFNPETHVIYSEYTATGGAVGGDTAHVFVKMNAEDLANGVNVVYGFAAHAGSSVGEFYARQFTVRYTSDDNGKIVGIDTEKVIIDGNPSGTSFEPSDGYEFDHWIADKDVKLGNGTVIKAGKELTPDQVKQVVVTEDVTFKVIYEKTSKDESEETPVTTPDTGASTAGGLNAEQIKISLVGLSLAMAAIAITPKLMRKKVGFNKK